MKVTPQHDLSWYIKWLASSVLLAGMILRAVDEQSVYKVLDLSLNLFGLLGWLSVGLLWHDRSIIILNAVGATIIGMGLLNLVMGV